MVPTFSYNVNNFQGSNIKHGDYNCYTVLYNRNL